MSPLKRVGLSFVSAIFAEFAVGICLVIWKGPFLSGLAGFASVLVLPGWILALPMVLLVRDLANGKVWTIALVGCCIGPFIMLTIRCYGAIRGYSADFAGGTPLFLTATAISFLTTLIYIGALKRVQPSNIRPVVKPTHAR
jgi:hypothetical protein